MQLNNNLTTTNIEISEETKDYLAKRVKKFEQFIADNTSPAIADIELERMTGQQSGEIFRAEVNLKAGDVYLRAEEEAEDIRTAIDEVREEMVRQLRKEQEKQREQARSGAREAKEKLRNQPEAADSDSGWSLLDYFKSNNNNND